MLPADVEKKIKNNRISFSLCMKELNGKSGSRQETTQDHRRWD
jgi:hypothetical protein